MNIKKFKLSGIRLPILFLLTATLPGLLLLALTKTSFATPTATLTLGIAEISEGNDFATRVLALPWDMNGPPYPDFPTAFTNVDRPSFVANGVTWNMTATNNDPNVWLHWSSIIDTQEVLRLGDKYPIDTSLYKLLSFQLCNNSGANNFANVYWMYDKSPHLNPNNGITQYFVTKPGCRVYVLHLPESVNYQGTWTGQPLALRIDPATVQMNFQMDWARLTTRDTSNVVPLNWTGATPNSTLYFYLSSTACGTNGYFVGTASAGGSGNGTFNWGATLQDDPEQNTQAGAKLPIPESFEPGNYYVYALENNTGTPICSGGTLKIHKAPLLTEFLSPSTFSGQDFATTVLNDAWGMSEPTDVKLTLGVVDLQFNNGIADIWTNIDDPQLYLLYNDNTINASLYKYVTFSFFVEGDNPFAAGGVQRLLWWYTGPAIDAMTTEDMILYEGWQRYSFDLSTGPMEPGSSWGGFPKVFRFDPIEMPIPALMHLDYLLLTTENYVQQGNTFEINYTTSPATGVTVSFYYDTDKNPGNGRTPITTGNSLAHPLGGNNFFLPLVKHEAPPPEIDILTGISRFWNTSADVSDGFMTTTWYSEVPVIIVP